MTASLIMTLPVIIIVLTLATWRVAAMFTKETGPWHVFEKLRELSGIQHGQDGNVLVVPMKFFAELLSCVWCFSIYSATFWVLLYLALPWQLGAWIALPFALSSIAIFIDKFV